MGQYVGLNIVNCDVYIYTLQTDCHPTIFASYREVFIYLHTPNRLCHPTIFASYREIDVSCNLEYKEERYLSVKKLPPKHFLKFVF